MKCSKCKNEASYMFPIYNGKIVEGYEARCTAHTMFKRTERKYRDKELKGLRKK